MVAPCALCKGRNPKRTHVFPQNTRAEVQLKWIKAMDLPKEREDAVLAEMREMEENGSRPRWCSFHFEYDRSGIHFPKYFDPEEGKIAQGWKEEDEVEEEDEEADSALDESMSSEPRRSSRKRAAPTDEASSSHNSPVLELSLQKILAEAGISLPGVTDKADESSKPSSSSKKREEKATSVEKTLQSILMDAGLPVPETLQAKTGMIVDEDSDAPVTPLMHPIRKIPVGSPSISKRFTVADAKRMGTFSPAELVRGGSTLAMPKKLTNPIAAKAAGELPNVIMPKFKPNAARMPTTFYNHNTMEKYDDSDALRNFKMPCKEDCRSELTVIMNRTRALEEQFDELSNNVLSLVQMYKTKAPLAYRPPQSLATIQGRVASVAGPVYGRVVPSGYREVPSNSLAVQERRDRRNGNSSKKEPERLLTDDDLAGAVRRRVSKEAQSSADEEGDPTEEEEEEESAEEEEWKPHSRRRAASDRESSSESPPRLDMNE